MLVGEAPGEKEVEKGLPFVGTSGWFLDQCLAEAGLFRGLAFCTNVLRQRPPDNDLIESGWVATKAKQRTADHHLIQGQWVNGAVRFGMARLDAEIAMVRPTIVIAFGNLALWALTGKWGIRKWRSSVLQGEVDGHKFKVIPTVHPAAVLREWTFKPIFIHDLRRAKAEWGKGPVVTAPDNRFIIRPDYPTAASKLWDIWRSLEEAPGKVRLAADIETRAGHIACIGLAWSKTEAICIPWMCVERLDGYWTLDEETKLVSAINQILTHPKADLVWQNGAYDHQYEHRWHFIQPNLGWDTMIAQHSMFSVSPKSLDHLSSLYCDHHVYWKDDGKLWDPSMPEDDLWRYNCEDCIRTYEIAVEEQAAVAALAEHQWPALPSVVDFQHRLQPAVVRMMLRGVRSDDITRRVMENQLETRIGEIQAEIERISGQPLNTSSPKQMVEFFYDILAQTPIYQRLPNGKRGNPTCDDDALVKIASREPILRPLIARIQALRSARVFKSTFVQMPRDTDGRLRCSYNVAGTKTYRFSSSENAFGSGGNLQNIPKGDEDDPNPIIPLPNIRKLFLFDEGMEGFDLDGDSADLRIVTGESGCRQMQAYFAAGVKPYVEIAREYYRDRSITKHHRSYKFMKALCHGTNYGGEPPGLSERVGLLVHEVERIQTWYFGMCPEIKKWQEEIRRQGEHRGFIENPFGYRLYNWDRWSRKVANEFLAWTPQSTVGILINHILLAIDQQLPEVQLLLQVHDSLTGQYPQGRDDLKAEILRIASEVVIPCQSGPITVPAGMKTSTHSWGDCE